MSDYIKRSDALKSLYNDYAYAAMDVIKRVPAADVAEVVHAKWIPFHSEAAGDIQYCSACDIGFDARMDYCPHCGARMDGWMEDADNGE
jgi:hypothetical protein